MTPSNPSAWRCLARFARGYLHQDYADTYGSAARALAAFAADAPARDVAALEAELAALASLTHGWSLAEVRAFLADRLGAAWSPQTRREFDAFLRTPVRAPERRQGCRR